MRIVFMGTSEFGVPTLERLVASEHPLIAVYTQPDKPAGRGRSLSVSPVKKMAIKYGLEVRQPNSLNEADVLESLAQLNPDVIVVAAFGKILPEDILNMPPFGCVNIHPSLLPRHRGPSPIQGAILSGDDCTGVTIMLMDRGVDSGPILAQKRVPIAPEDSAESLITNLAHVGAQLLEETLPRWLSHAIIPQPQNDDEASYTKSLSKEQGETNWHLPALEIWRQVRAFQPWPGCYTRWRGKALKVVDASHLPGAQGEPGRVITLAGGGVGVQTAEGVLELLRVQLEGKRKMSAEDFVRGQRDFIGALLPC